MLIVGIDGGTWSVLQPAMQAGYMPYLKALVEGGASGILESTLPAITPAAWSAFQTGMNPGATGVHDFHRWNRRSKTFEFVNSSMLPKTIWERASKAQKLVGLVNVPMTYPPQKINGYIISGILSPSVESEFTYPPGLKQELLTQVPSYHIFNIKDARTALGESDFKSFVNKMAQVLHGRIKAAQLLIEKSAFDVLMVHFQATDAVQHALWGYLDEGHESYDSQKRGYIFDNLFKVLDEKIGQLRTDFQKRVGDNFLTLLISDHGFERHIKRFNLGNWLCQEGFLQINPRSEKVPLTKRVTRKLRLGRLLSCIFGAGAVSKMERSLRLDIDKFIWEKSRAFSMGRSGEGFIYLLEDDQAKARQTASELIEKLSQVCDEEMGEKVIKSIRRKEEIFTGSMLDVMPDLIVEPISGYSCTGAHLANEKRLFHKVTSETDFHVGKHHPDGIVVVSGPGVNYQKMDKKHLVDMAPTILYYLGLPVGPRIDGKVLTDLFADEFVAANPVKECSDTGNDDSGKEADVYTGRDEAKIRERLEDLGYL